MVSGMSSVVLLSLLGQCALAMAKVVPGSMAPAPGSMVLYPEDLQSQKCLWFVEDNLKQIRCRDHKFEKVPNNLHKGIQVLDISENRIRTLYNNSLSPYHSLQYLYLQDNFIQKIEEAAFDPVEDLEVLDLSKNALTQLPKSLFQIQYLRNLYLSTNQLTDNQLEISNVFSPLEKLHLASNSLRRMPRLSPLTQLRILNVSKNDISNVSVNDLAPMCMLKTLDLTENPIRFDQNNCDCIILERWIKDRNITVLGADNIQCSNLMSLREKCRFETYTNHTLKLYNSCMTVVRDKQRAEEARATWIWIASCIGAFVGFIFVALCCMHSRNRDKSQILKEQEILESSNNANTEQLLNKEINHEQS